MNLDSFERYKRPFVHWMADDFIDDDVVRMINAQWPTQAMEVESGVAAKLKGALLFPKRLPPAAQSLAEALYSPAALESLSARVGMDLLPDPWLHEGPDRPMLGGGLHEIHRGGLLKVHVDFEAHPSGLRRVANLLVYLNEDWRDEWGGHLVLHSPAETRRIAPLAGRAVLFRTKPNSWHGHPDPLACPSNRTRRSLALYYYAKDAGGEARPKTVYRSKA